MATDFVPVVPSNVELPPIPKDVVARVDGSYFTKEQALEWLQNEEQRANRKAELGEDGNEVRGAFAQANACARLLRRVQKLTAPPDKPLDLRTELAELRRRPGAPE